MPKERHGVHLIAQIAHVSIGTVDRALHGRPGIKKTTRQRILEIARQIGETPNLAARALSAARSGARIGVCIPREIHFFYDQLWRGVLDEAKSVAQLGIEFVKRPVRSLGEGDTEAVQELMAEGVDGIILTAGNPKGLKPLIDEAENKCGLRGPISERMPRGRIDGQVSSTRIEGGRGGGHVDDGRPSQEGGWLHRDLSRVLPRREDCSRHRRSRR